MITTFARGVCTFVRKSVPTFGNSTKQNYFQVRIVIATGGIVVPAEWITSVLFLSFFLVLHDLEIDPSFKFEQSNNKTGVINDPLGQTHSHASSEHCFLLFWITCAKTMIPTRHDFGLVE